jgi:hypothetical protein
MAILKKRQFDLMCFESIYRHSACHHEKQKAHKIIECQPKIQPDFGCSGFALKNHIIPKIYVHTKCVPLSTLFQYCAF